MDPKHCLLLLLAHPKLRFRKNKMGQSKVPYVMVPVPFCMLLSSNILFFSLDGYAK